MGGSSKQTVGFKYFVGMQVAIGNCIERIIDVNPDKRGWIFNSKLEQDQLKQGDTSIQVNKPDLFGGDKQEGGWVGTIDIHTGQVEHLRQNEYLATHDSDLVSSFPGLSHLVFRGNSLDRGFQVVSMSGMLKEVLYWVKRIYVKDDGSSQWFSQRAEVPEVIEYHGSGSGIVPGTFSLNRHIEERYKGQPPNIINDYLAHYNNGLVTGTGYIAVGRSNYEDKEGDGDGPHETSYYFDSSNLAGLLVVKYTVTTISESYSYEWDSSTAVLSDIFLEQTEQIDEDDVVITTRRYEALIDVFASQRIGQKIRVKGGLKKNSGDYRILGVVNAQFEPMTMQSDFKTYTGDMNPIHKIREIITDDTAMNKPESMINEESFIGAASRIWDEELGVSGAFTEKSCKEAIDELLFHIEAGIRLNRQTGQYEIVLFRDDLLDLDNAIVFNKRNIKSFNIEIANIEDVINSVNVNFYDRENIKDSSFSLDEIGSIMSSELDATSLDFPYYMRRKNAELVGNWKLKQLSTPIRKGTLTTGKYEARKINKYDVVKLTWVNQNMNEIPVRIMKIGLGDGRDNTVALDWVEVVPYSSTVFPTINVDPPTSVVLPPQPNQSTVFEMPYFEAVQRFGQTQVDGELANNPDLGYLVVATKKPQGNSINALLYTNDGTGYQQASIVDYCPVATLDQAISYLNTSFAVKNVANISQAEVGTLILCEDELMVYQNYDPETKVLTVKRAALDTHPRPHTQDAVFYFYDAFNAFDSEQYVFGETIHAKVLTTTPSGVLDMLEAPDLSLEINARPIRPYPPVNIKLNDIYFPQSIVVSNNVVVTWVDRNRIQQTGGSILGWTDGGVAKETGVTYSIELSSEDVVLGSETGISGNTYTFDSSLLISNKPHKLRLWSVRDSYESYQIFEHNFFGEAVSLILTATVSKDQVVGSTVPIANITVDVDESLKANMRFDGSSITGKTSPGATITIEVEE